MSGCEAAAARWEFIKEYCALSNWQETNCKALGRLLSGQACADDTNTTPTPGDDETCVDMNEECGSGRRDGNL